MESRPEGWNSGIMECWKEYWEESREKGAMELKAESPKLKGKEQGALEYWNDAKRMEC
jgi:hypothetical protein